MSRSLASTLALAALILGVPAEDLKALAEANDAPWGRRCDCDNRSRMW